MMFHFALYPIWHSYKKVADVANDL